MADQEDDPQYYKYIVALAVDTVSSRWDLQPQNEVKEIKMVMINSKNKEVVERYNVRIGEEGLAGAIRNVDSFFKNRGLEFPEIVFVCESRWALDTCVKLEAACKQISLKEKHWCYFMDLRVEALKAGLEATDMAGIADAVGVLHQRANLVDSISAVVVELLKRSHKFKSPQVVTNSLLSTMQQLWLEGGSEKDDVKTAIDEYSAIVVTGIPESERSGLTVDIAQNFMKPIFVPYENIVLKPASAADQSVQIFFLTPDKHTWQAMLACYKKSWKGEYSDIDVLPVCLNDVIDAGWKGIPPQRPAHRAKRGGQRSTAPTPSVPSTPPSHVDPYSYSAYVSKSPYSAYCPPSSGYPASSYYDYYGYPKAPPPTRNGISPYVVFISGLPYATSEFEISEFLYGVDVKCQGIHLICGPDDKTRGICFVELNTYQDLAAALERDRLCLRNAYVGVVRSSDAELSKVMYRAAKLSSPFAEIPVLSQQFRLPEDSAFAEKYYLHSPCSNSSHLYPQKKRSNESVLPPLDPTPAASPVEPQSASNNDSSNGSLTS